MLRQCLATLAAQTTDGVEAVVVDDGSATDVTPAIENARVAGLDVRLVRVEHQGANPARNRGAAESSGRVLAFLDDDVLLSPGWAAALLDSRREHGWDGVAGRTELQLPFEPRWLIAPLRPPLSEFDLGEDFRWLAPPHYPWACNCAITRDAFERAGGFDESAGRVGVSLTSNDEVALFDRVRRHAGRIGYVPGARAVHQVAPDRLRPEWFLRRAYAQGYSDELLRAPAQGRLEASLRALEMLVTLRRTPRMIASAARRRHGLVHVRCQMARVQGGLDALRHRADA